MSFSFVCSSSAEFFVRGGTARTEHKILCEDEPLSYVSKYHSVHLKAILFKAF